ncbi:hypothetical protein [Nonomuraea sp. NPDC049709]|uniref:hypothetical protein n=1 Tax=Nonomuraea sp. NPDC049709 TaxID=3154736 RepID=UPI003426E1A7
MQLTLKRQRPCRPRLKLTKWAWVVAWEAPNGGILTKPHSQNRITGPAVEAPIASVETRSWDVLACALIARKLGEDLARYGYRSDSVEG